METKGKQGGTMSRGKETVFANIGASNHSKTKRQTEDYYTTHPIAIDLLEKHGLLDDGLYWECACGMGSLSERLKRYGYEVCSSDLYDRKYGKTGINFLEQSIKVPNILTNPPYKFVNQFILKGLELATNKLYIFARLQTLETLKRHRDIFKDTPPSFVCPFVRRVPCYRNNVRSKSHSAVAYAWFIWDIKDKSKECRVKWLI